MFTRDKKNFDVINFLQSQHFISFTHQIDATHPNKNEDGIIPAGSFYPKNDATAIGLTINDVDVSKGEQPIGVIVEGYILEERLPESPTPEAKAALTGIKFYSENNQPSTVAKATKSKKETTGGNA
ncbi:hypothetical protein AALA52_03720 [Lactococcus ileimucosae]|uniref:Phage protein n=1 Tax=Lactococcus ileimucosae TaxID=2941329 RepID=A0ABV4D1B8_9LACT|nr:hypothetical protein [Lactococcus ileimucosae]